MHLIDWYQRAGQESELKTDLLWSHGVSEGWRGEVLRETEKERDEERKKKEKKK